MSKIKNKNNGKHYEEQARANIIRATVMVMLVVSLCLLSLFCPIYIYFFYICKTFKEGIFKSRKI